MRFPDFSLLKNNLTIVEYIACFEKDEGSLIFGENVFNTAKIKSLMSTPFHDPIWLNYGEIAESSSQNPVQLDLLKNIQEPVLIIPPGHLDYYLVIKMLKSGTSEILYNNSAKQLIEMCLIFFLLNHCHSVNRENSISLDFFQVSLNQNFEILNLNNKFTEQQITVEKHFLNLFKLFLEEELRAGEEIFLNKETLNYLTNLNAPYKKLKSAAIQALHISRRLNPGASSLPIYPSYLVLLESEKVTGESTINGSPSDQGLRHGSAWVKDANPSSASKASKNTPSAGRSKSRLERTMSLLDRYEDATNKLIASKTPLLGKNLARACDPVISAPALTDSINKHRKRIVECINFFPEKWPNLKANYLPIQKLLLR